MSKMKTVLIKHKAKTIALVLALTLIAAVGSTFALFSDRIGATLSLTIAQWQGEPILAANQTWFIRDNGLTSEEAARIASISIVDLHTSNGTETRSWDASHAQDGSVMAYYFKDTATLIVAGNGSGYIYANPDSSYAFSFASDIQVDKDTIEHMAFLREITGMDLLDTSMALDMTHMFDSNTLLAEVDVSGFDSSLVSNMSYMFNRCFSLETTDYTGLETGKVTDMSYMFNEVESVSTLNVSSFDTRKVTSMQGMFQNCGSLKTLNVSNFSTPAVKNMSFMFQGCGNLKTLTIDDSFVTNNVTTTESMFQKCLSLPSINISGWNLAKVTNSTSMFERCNAFTKLTIPASLKVIGNRFAYECQKLTTFVFQHGENLDVTLPTPGSSTGAFYVGTPYSAESPLWTNIGTKNTEILAYSWETDHRANREPVLAPYWTSMDSVSADETAILAATTVTALNHYDATVVAQNATAGPWDISEAQDESVMGYLVGTNLYVCSNVNYNTKIIANRNSRSAFSGFSSATKIDLTQLDTSRAVTAAWMLSGNSKVTKYVGLDTWDTGKIENMQWMLGSNSKLEDFSFVNGWDVSTCFDFQNMFYRCEKMKNIDVSDWKLYTGPFEHHDQWYPDNPNAKTTGIGMDNMFSWCYDLEYVGNISNWDVRNVTRFSSMFNRCEALVSVGSSATGPSDLSSWANKVTNVTHTDEMFQHCYKLKNVTGLANWQTNALEDCSGMFMDCLELTEMDLSNWNTEKLELFFNMFSMSPAFDEETGHILDDSHGHPVLASKLESIDISGWVVKKDVVVHGYGMLSCTPITELTLGPGWEYLPYQVFFNCTKLQTIHFEHTASDTLEFSLHVFGLLDSYNFSFDHILETTTNTNNATIRNVVNAYSWVEDYRDEYIAVHFNANGGSFPSGTVNTVGYNPNGMVIKATSQTANLNEKGEEIDAAGYGDDQEFVDVVTIPGATSLYVSIDYETEYSRFDWVCVYDGSVTPTASNYADSISGKLGGTYQEPKTYVVEGDTVQFFFKSDDSNSGYYGYYAQIQVPGYEVVVGEYSSPTAPSSSRVFQGWYTDKACSAGKEFDPFNDVDGLTSDITVYAKWVDASALAAELFLAYDEQTNTIAGYHIEK